MSASHKAEYDQFLVLKEGRNRQGVKRKAESDVDSERDDDEEDLFNYDRCKSIKLEADEFRIVSEDNLEFIGVSGQPQQNQRMQNSNNAKIPSTSELMKENRFINLVYPEFAGKSRLQLIDEIRMLRDKNKVYKGTIDRYLNN